ncbi:MAG: isochorismatase family protein [Candidatus Ancillula sp.]|jgi:nicotinamidase-related amidase|nr:isochorismatase family protein [Candidatus Ancillula sp.]
MSGVSIMRTPLKETIRKTILLQDTSQSTFSKRFLGSAFVLILATSTLFAGSFISDISVARAATQDEDVSVVIKDSQNNEICTLDTDAEKCDLAAEEYGEGIIALDLKNKAVQLNGVDAPEVVVSLSSSLTLKGDKANLSGLQQVDSSQTTTIESGTYKFASTAGAGLDIAGALIVKPNVSVKATGTSSGVYVAGNIILDDNSSLVGITTSASGVGVIGNGISVSAGTVLEGRSDPFTYDASSASEETSEENTPPEDGVAPDATPADDLLPPAEIDGQENTTIGIAVGWGNSFIGAGASDNKAKIKAVGNTGISLTYPEDGSYPTGDISLLDANIEINARAGAGITARQVDFGAGVEVSVNGANSAVYSTGKLNLNSATFNAVNVAGGLYSAEEVHLEGGTKVSISSTVYGILSAKKVFITDQCEVSVKRTGPNIAPVNAPDEQSVEVPLSDGVSGILSSILPYTGISALDDVSIDLIEEGYLDIDGYTASTSFESDASLAPDDLNNIPGEGVVIPNETPADGQTDAERLPLDPTQTPDGSTTGGDDVGGVIATISYSGAALSCGDSSLVQSVDPSQAPPAVDTSATTDAGQADANATPEEPSAEWAANTTHDCNINIGAKTEMTPKFVKKDDANVQSFIKAVYYDSANESDSPAANVKIKATPVPWYVSLWRALGVFLILIILLALALLGWILYLLIHKKPALLVMSLQNATIKDNVYKLSLDASSRQKFAYRIGEYIQKYRRRYKKIFLCQEVHENDPGVMEHFHTWGEHALSGTESAEFVPNIKLLQGLKNVAILTSGQQDDGYNAFNGTTDMPTKDGVDTVKLLDALKKFKVKRIKIVGLPLDYAILKTALEGVRLLGDGKVEVLANLTASVTDRDKITLKMREKNIVIR